MCTIRLEVVTEMMGCMRSGHVMLHDRLKCSVHSTVRGCGQRYRNVWMVELTSRLDEYSISLNLKDDNYLC